MIETLFLIQLVALIAYVPASDGGYTEWDIIVSETEFRASTDYTVFVVVGYNPEQFTNQMVRLWNFELKTFP